MGTSGRTMQPKGRPQASFTVLASGMTASVNDVMRGRGAAVMVMREGGARDERLGVLIIFQVAGSGGDGRRRRTSMNATRQ
jgi:hypothetical protein